MTRKLEKALLVFLLLRLSLVAITFAVPDGGVLTDSTGYLALAKRLAVDWHYGVQASGEADLLRPPAYSLFLAILIRLLGPELYYVTGLQLAMSGLTSWLLLLLGKEVERPTVGLAAAWLYALSPNVALWSLTVMTEVPFALMLALTTYLAVRAFKASGRSWPLWTGALLGLSAYLRPIALTLLPAWGAVAYWFTREAAGRRRVLLSSLALVAIGGLITLPWAIRNWSRYDRFVFSTATTKTWEAFNLAEVVALAEGTTRNRAAARLDSDRGLLPLTLEVARRYPLAYVKVQTLGVARSLTGSDVGTWGNVLGDDTWTGLGLLSGAFRGSLDEAIQQLGAQNDPSFKWRLMLIVGSLAYTAVLMGLALLGLVLYRGSGRLDSFVMALALGNFFILLVVPAAAGQARFRVPAEPFLSLIAGYGVRGLLSELAKRRSHRTAEPAAVGVQELGSG